MVSSSTRNQSIAFVKTNNSNSHKCFFITKPYMFLRLSKIFSSIYNFLKNVCLYIQRHFVRCSSETASKSKQGQVNTSNFLSENQSRNEAKNTSYAKNTARSRRRRLTRLPLSWKVKQYPFVEVRQNAACGI